MQSRDELINQYMEFVRRVVENLIKKFQLPREFYDDYIASGYLGLVEAADRYKAERGVPFTDFAFLRVRGSVIDYIRKSSILKGEAYKYFKAMQASLNIREDFPVVMRENSKEKKVKDPLLRVFEYASFGLLAYRITSASFDINELQEGHTTSQCPDQSYLKKCEILRITRAIEALEPSEREIIKRYYFEDLTFKEIGEILGGVTTSWICRLHKQALCNLKDILHKDDAYAESKVQSEEVKKYA
jgi:RNA polymerase sigma factor FliA